MERSFSSIGNSITYSIECMSEPQCFECGSESVIHKVGTTKAPSVQRRDDVYQCSACYHYTNASTGAEVGYEEIFFDKAKINSRHDKAIAGY
jgi:hypothetical protein